MAADRRQLRNFFLQPRAQLRYAVRFFVFTALAIAIVQMVSYWTVSRVVLRVLNQAGGQASALQEIVDLAIRTELIRVWWLMPVIGAAALLFTGTFLHRFVGPSVPLRRHIQALTRGEYGGECRTRVNDELQDVVADVNALSQALQSRHGETAKPAARRRIGIDREAGFSILELLVVMSLIMIIGMLGVAQFLRAFDRSRQRGTLADMRSIAAANGTFRLDTRDYAGNLADLEPTYMQSVPPVDRWGFAWSYTQSPGTYTLSSNGSDGASGPAPPTDWSGTPFECDLILQDGAFSQTPDF